MDKSESMRCPICDSALPIERAQRAHGAFCSARCRLLDLSKWLGDGYVIAGPSMYDGFAADPEQEQPDAE